MSVKDEMTKIAERLIKEVCSIDKPEDAEELVDGALGIGRKQDLVDGEWVTNEYELLMTFGGPNTYLRVNDIGLVTVSVYWGSKKYETFKKCYGAQLLFEYLKDVLG